MCVCVCVCVLRRVGPGHAAAALHTRFWSARAGTARAWASTRATRSIFSCSSRATPPCRSSASPPSSAWSRRVHDLRHVRHVQRATGDVQHATSNRRRAACDVPVERITAGFRSGASKLRAPRGTNRHSAVDARRGTREYSGYAGVLRARRGTKGTQGYSAVEALRRRVEPA